MNRTVRLLIQVAQKSQRSVSALLKDLKEERQCYTLQNVVENFQTVLKMVLQLKSQWKTTAAEKLQNT